MVAKIWKKLLLAVCIIAILFDITAKLVNRTSLEKAISSSPEGVDIKELFNVTEPEKTTNKKESSVSQYKTIDEVKAEMKNVEEEKKNEEYIQEVQQEEIQNEEHVSEEFIEDEKQENLEKSTGGQIIDQMNDTIKNAKESVKVFY